MNEERPPESDAWPPGEFVDEEQQDATKRFVEEARTLAERRTIPPRLDDDVEAWVPEARR